MVEHISEFERRSTELLHATDELRKLLLENPDLPLLVFAGDDCNSGDYSYMSCGHVSACVGEFLDCMQEVNDERCYTDRDEFEEALYDYLYDGNIPEEEYETLCKECLAAYDPYWKKCIILYVDN